jgi:quinol monooxygenase YgiN
MPVAVHITPNQMSKDDYDRVIGELEASGLSQPDGRLYHAAYGQDQVHMFEIWESEEDFDAHRDRMFAVLQGAGVDGGTVDVHPLHSGVPD